MITLADVSTGYVTDLIVLDGYADAVAYRRGWIDVTELDPAPQIGWAWDGIELKPEMSVSLPTLRSDRVGGLRSACATAIVSGFSSNALGAPHAYPSDETDQRNLSDACVAAATAAQGWSTSLWCEASGAWALTPHTAAQVQQVMADWIAYRAAQQERLVTLLADIQAAINPAAITAVTW